MNVRSTLTVLILLNISVLTFAQQPNAVHEFRVEVKEGNNIFRVPGTSYSLFISTQKGTITKLTKIEANGNKIDFQTMDEKQTRDAGWGNCKCGTHCWESPSTKESICVCKSCTPNSGPILITIRGNSFGTD